jgi:hypothetical protein
MFDWAIFNVGVFTFLLLAGGLIFSVRELRRLGSEAAPIEYDYEFED